MHLGGIEPNGCKIEVDQRTQSDGGNNGADTDRTAEKEADDRYEHIYDRAACTGRPPELTRERDHQRVTGAAAERAFHVQPGAERKQLQTADEHGNAAHQSVHLRDEVCRLDRVDYDRAARNVDDRAEAEALAEEHGREDGCRACDSGRCAVGHAGSQRHALLQHAPRLESDIRLQHHRNADRTDRNTQDQPEQPAHVILKHESILLLSD